MMGAGGEQLTNMV